MFLCFVIALSVVTVSLTAATNVATYNGKEIRSNRIVVVNDSILKKLPAKPDQTMRLESARQAYQGRIVRNLPTEGIAEWEIKGDMQKALNALNAIDGISAFPNFVFKRENLQPKPIQKDALVPHEPYLSLQWALNNDGTFAAGAVAGADISAFDAWDITTGGTYPVEGGGTEDIIVAIYDDGIDINHEDLRNNIWINPGEDINNDGIIDGSDVNGIDDDGNGFVDDFFGWNVMNDDNSYLNSGSFHGTHVAGIIGAEGNNELGIAGVNHHIKMLSVLIWDDYGSTDAITLMYGYYYLSTLLKSGVKIVAVNQSWGGGAYLNDRDEQRFVEVMTKYAREHDAYGMIWVCSAGNDNINADKLNYYAYPRLIQSPNVICVGSTDYADNKSDFSNYGQATVDIGAPGTDIASCLPGNIYGFMSGTSMAAPHVTGVIALAKSVFPEDDAHDLIARTLATADQVSNLSDVWESGKRLNAYRTVAPMIENKLLSSNAETEIQKNFTDDFGVATVGFVNGKDIDVSVTSVTISGAQASCFSLPTMTFPITVKSGGAFGIPVMFVSNAGGAASYNATLTITAGSDDVIIPLVGIEQGYAEMAIEPELTDLGVVHYGDTLTSTFIIKNTGEADLNWHLFQYLISNNVEPEYDLTALNNFKPQPALTNKTPKNKTEVIQKDFEKIAPVMAELNRPKITLDFNQEVENYYGENILWADSLNDSTATMEQWTLMAFGSGEGANETWRLVDISDGGPQDFVFLAGDFDNGYKNNTIAVAATPLFDFTPTADGKGAAYLAFDYAALLEQGCDYFYVNVIVDGERWGTILQTEWELWPDGYTYRAYADISELVGAQNVEFWFILNTDYSMIGGFGALFDNVEIGIMDLPYFADNYQGTLTPDAQASVTSTIRTGMLDLGEYFLINEVESDALNNWFGVNMVHFNNVIGHLSVNPEVSELGSFYHNQSANSTFNLINDGVVEVEFESNWYIQNNYDNEEHEDEVFIIGGAETEAKINSAAKSSVKKDGVTVKPSERIKKVAECYSNIKKLAQTAIQPAQPVKTALASKIFRPETVGTVGPLLAENFDASMEMPAGWIVEDRSYGLGDVWHIENVADIKSNALYFGDPVEQKYYANSETYAYTPIINVGTIPDSEALFLEFDYACYVEEGYDYFDLYIGVLENEDSEQIIWQMEASSEWGNFTIDGELHSISFDLSWCTNWMARNGYEKMLFCFGARSDESVSNGGILVDNVALNTRLQDTYLTPRFGTIETGATLPVEAHINMKNLYPGNWVMVSEFYYNYYSFEYYWWDDSQARQYSTFSVLNHKPVAVDDTLNVLAGDTVNFMALTNDAMANDYDEDLDELFFWDATDPLYGSLKWTAIEEEGDYNHDYRQYYSYVAPLNFDGLDVFEYQISDGFDSDIGKVTIRVATKPHFVAGTQQEYTFLEDSTLVLNTMRIVPGVGGVDKELYVWGKTKGTLVKIDADRVNRRLTLATKTEDAWGQETAMLYVGHTDNPVDSLKITIVVVPVNDPPTSGFAITKTNNTVTFTDQSNDSRDPEGAIVEWLWDFGDGGTSTEQNPVHVYTAINTYSVTLTVKDNSNATAITTHNVQITNLVGIASEIAIPEKFELSQNFPNPFNPMTTIRYALPEKANVRLTIYNMLGKEVRTLVNEVEEAGYKSVIWDGLDQYGRSLSTGVYIYRIQAGNFTQTRKMVFMK